MCQYSFNPYREKNVTLENDEHEIFYDPKIFAFHRSLDDYSPTPVASLPNLAGRLGLKDIRIKDESHRFGLKAFKALGASYAIYRFLEKELSTREGRFSNPEQFWERVQNQKIGNFTFCTASDGNHGRGVAWTARKLNQRAVVYMPENTVPARIDNIRREGAEVFVIDGNYDKAVVTAAENAQKYNWQIISDTSYSGYMEIPAWIMAGYMTIFKELETVSGNIDISSDKNVFNPDFVFIQAGVGALAAAASVYYTTGYKEKRPCLIGVEPLGADCLLESVRFGCGDIRTARRGPESIMAGLNCQTPSLLAWKYIKKAMDIFVAIPDSYAIDAVKTFYYPYKNDPVIVSGESGAAGLGALLALMKSPQMADARDKLRIGNESSVLLINTEGDTDPENFKRIIES